MLSADVRMCFPVEHLHQPQSQHKRKRKKLNMDKVANFHVGIAGKRRRCVGFCFENVSAFSSPTKPNVNLDI